MNTFTYTYFTFPKEEEEYVGLKTCSYIEFQNLAWFSLLSGIYIYNLFPFMCGSLQDHSAFAYLTQCGFTSSTGWAYRAQKIKRHFGQQQ